ncbi:MAG: hypothetical protein KC544_02985 [Gemmatimonadetes bacterium]|nr:hypothetical protein [Gemmatimonadota bacterium]MCB9505039.1 hypothetical protein [Gemmatimonadales bacterium]MCA9762077.1 hypothetical protein [Gemmatimonadota bacterium]MCA9767869.1 hypothetical protein [Gemmatimonadota bacterium]MCB9517742.1 hypothetical protein [Gemmatimonadales bacterium]
MPKAIRSLLLGGVLLTAVALVGMAATAGVPRPETGWLSWIFIPLYGVGAGMLIAAGLWWLVRFTRRRDDAR